MITTLRPFPEIVNKLYDLLYYESDFDEARNLFNKIKDPYEKLLSRIWIANFDLLFNDIQELKAHAEEFQAIIDSFSDPFHNFLAKFGYYAIMGIINNGLLTPGENFLKSKEYFKKLIDLIDDHRTVLSSQDQWFFIYFEMFKTLTESYFTNELDEKVRYLKRCVGLAHTMPIDTEIYVFLFSLELIFIFIQVGKFQEAFEILLSSPYFHNILFNYIKFEYLANICYIKGDLNNSLDYMKKNLDLCTKNHFSWGVSRLKANMGNLYEELAEFEIAKDNLLESLELRKRFSNVFDCTFAYYNLIRFFINRYQIQRDEQLLTEATNFLHEFKEYLDQHDEIIVSNFYNICNALILQFGRFEDKSKAYKILKDLVPLFPNLRELQIFLIELLLNEVKINDNNPEILKEIIDELDNLMNQLSKLGLYSQRISIVSYVSYQILIAKYFFLIKGEIKESLGILNKAYHELNNFDLPVLKDKVKVEINNINEQIKKWQDPELTFQERLQSSDFEEYFNQISRLSNKQKG